MVNESNKLINIIHSLGVVDPLNGDKVVFSSHGNMLVSVHLRNEIGHIKQKLEHHLELKDEKIKLKYSKRLREDARGLVGLICKK